MFASWDVETQGLGGKLLAFSWCLEDGAPHYFTDKNPDEISWMILQTILENPCYQWYAHNSQYDWRYLIPLIRHEKVPVKYLARNDNNLYGIVIEPEGRKILMLDSFASWNRSLKDLADNFCPELPKQKIDIENFDPTNPEHIEYSKRDSLALLTGLIRFNDQIKKLYGVNLSVTFASTAMLAWRQTIPEGIKYFGTPRYETFIRKAYYGGLVLPLNIAPQKNCKTYDLNSSYPAVMRQFPYPHGNCYVTDKLDKNELGIFAIEVKTPDNLHCPVLGYREKKRTLWPRGHFITYATSPEIIFAKKVGYEINIIKGIQWTDKVFPFGDFVDMSETARNKFKGLPAEIVAKYIQNSNYGKFGANRERSVVFDMESEELSEEMLIGAEPLSEDGLYRKKEFSEEMFVIPAWAAFVTAYGRLRLLETIYDIGVQYVYYGDTDSLTVAGHIDLPVSNAYGAWKLEKQWKCFRAIAPKVYAGQLIDGQWIGAAKGMPKGKMQDYWQRVYNGDTFSLSYPSLPGFIQFLKGNGNLEMAKRKITDSKNSINWMIHNDIMLPRIIENAN